MSDQPDAAGMLHEHPSDALLLPAISVAVLTCSRRATKGACCGDPSRAQRCRKSWCSHLLAAADRPAVASSRRQQRAADAPSGRAAARRQAHVQNGCKVTHCGQTLDSDADSIVKTNTKPRRRPVRSASKSRMCCKMATSWSTVKAMKVIMIIRSLKAMNNAGLC